MIRTLTLPYPPSANRYWRSAPGKGLVPSAEATAYKRELGRVATGLQPFRGPVRVRLVVYRPRRSGDLDNCLKLLFDALAFIAWLDDDQVEHITADRGDDPANPRVELTIEGGAVATPAEVAAARAKKREAARKRKATRARNRRPGLAALATPAVIRGRR